jgi:hypothetical protein
MLTSHRARLHAALDQNMDGYFKLGPVDKTAGDGPGIVRTKLLKALGLLNDKLQEAGAHMAMWMIGGGNMMLHLDTRDSSGDLDVIPRKGDFKAMMGFAAEVAQEMTAGGEAIPTDWINGDFAPQLMTLRVSAKDFERDSRYHWTNMEIQFAKPELMLALKCFSMRPEGFDRADIAALMNRIPVRNLDHLYDIIEHYGDIEMLADGDDVLLESMFKQLRSQRPQA